MSEPPGAGLARWAAIIAHLALAGLLLAAIPGTLRCSGDFIGSCLFFLAPLLLAAAVFVLIGLGRWAGGPAGTLVVADIAALVLAWNFAATSGAALIVVGAVVAIVMFAAAEATREEPVDPHR
jgi:hypothetical protein